MQSLWGTLGAPVEGLWVLLLAAWRAQRQQTALDASTGLLNLC